MNSKPKLIISKNDYENLCSLLDRMPDTNQNDLLIDELERAKIVNRDRLPANVVSMNSTVTFTVTSTNKVFTFKLVYPHETTETGTLSILTPVGRALIGLSVNQEIEWPLEGNGTTRVLIDAITHD